MEKGSKIGSKEYSLKVWKSEIKSEICDDTQRRAAFDSEHDENTCKFDFDFGHGEKIQNHKLSEICNC